MWETFGGCMTGFPDMKDVRNVPLTLTGGLVRNHIRSEPCQVTIKTQMCIFAEEHHNRYLWSSR